MYEELNLLQQIRGLGLLEGRIVFGLDERGLKVRVTGRDPRDRRLRVEVEDTISPLYIQEGFVKSGPSRENLERVYAEIYEHLRSALDGRSLFEIASGPVELHGYCPHCSKTAVYSIPKRDQGPLLEKTVVTCSVCHNSCPASTAHQHQDGYIGECCWDERLRTTE